MNITGPVGLFNHSNDITGGLFSPFMLIVVFIVMFIAGSRVYTENPVGKSFVLSSFVVAVTSYFFYAMDLIQPTYVYTTTIIFVIALILYRGTNSQ